MAGKNVGEITIFAEEMKDIQMNVFLRFEGRNLDKKDWFGKSDPFLRILRKRQDNSWEAVHKVLLIFTTYFYQLFNVFIAGAM